MTDRWKTLLAAILFVLAVLLPWAALALGWYRWGLEQGLWLGAGTLLVLLLAAATLLWRLDAVSWLAASLPYLSGSAYTLLPDLLPGPTDDAAFSLFGAVLSALLARRRAGNLPRWVWVVLLAVALYPLAGGFLPGIVDESAVELVGYLLFLLAMRNGGEAAE